MNQLKALISNGRQYKAINPWDPDDTPEAWEGLVPKRDSSRLVPVVYAAWQMRCKAMGDLPFCIYGKGDNEIDNSDDYQNTVKFMPDPYQLLWKAEASLCGSGQSYFFIERNRSAPLDLRYMNPATMTVKIDTKKWKPLYFERKRETVTDRLKPEEVFYAWLPDPAVEVGPPTMYPLLSALVCASSLDAVNKFINDHASRGMTKMFLLAMKGNPPQQEREKIQSWWNSFWSKVKVRWMVFNADSIEPTIIGEGLAELKSAEVTRALEEQVLSAMGVPASLILADAANYATAQQDVRTFYQNTIMPDARIIQSAMNTQLLEPMGYHIEFEPQRLEPFQEDEAERATALSSLAKTLTNSKPEAVKLAMDLLGYDLTEEQKDMLEAMLKEKEENREIIEEQLKPKDEEEEKDDKAEQELERFKRKALKRIGKDVDFTSDIIPADVLERIHRGLADCKTADEVRGLFYEQDTVFYPDPIIELAEALREAAKALGGQDGEQVSEES